MRAFEDRLGQFSQDAAAPIDDLMAVVASAPATETAAAARAMLARYAQLVQQLGEMSAAAGLAGVRSACALVETNLLLMQDDRRAITPAESAMLGEWPMLLLSYLANGADRDSAAALLESLSGNWPIALPPESIADELQRLMGDAGGPPEPEAAFTPGDDAAAADISPAAEAALLLPPPPAATQHVEQPMLRILEEELRPLEGEFGAAVTAATEGADDERLAALAELLDFLDRIKITVESVGLGVLASLLSQISWQLVSLPSGVTGRHRELLQLVPARVAAYLAAPQDDTACSALAALLGDRAWPAPADGEALAAWEEALARVEIVEGTAGLAPARPTRAAAEDVSLEIPAEVNAELLDGLLQELPIQVAALTSALASITGGKGAMKDAEQAMRAAHTLKGAANTVGIPGIANLTHHLEDILVALIEAEKQPHGPLAGVLTDAGDCLEAMGEFLQGLGPAPDNAQSVLQAVLDWANRIDSEGLDAMAAAAPALAAGAAEPGGLQAGQDKGEEAPGAVAEERRPQPSLEHSVRVPAPLIDELLSLAGESLTSNSQLQEHLRSTVIQNEALHRQHQLIHRLLGELENLVDIRGTASQQQASRQQTVQGDSFDALEFEHYNELQTISRQLMEAATDAREMSLQTEEQLSALEEVLEEQQRLQMANQHALLRTRMMPVSAVLARLQRSVRQTGRLLDKAVRFTVRGEHTNIDTHVLNDLMDPLMHMLRNAVDHGIERSEVRAAAGKPAEGHIELSFTREGNTLVVRCRDDGAGLDYEAIRRIAESRGMIVPGHVHSNDELARLILMPGFSTREEASQVSGRGVGMDVVYSRVQQMKGMLTLHSQQGQGLAVELRLPATLLSTHALIIRQREKRLAISTRGIEDIRYVARENIIEIGARQFVRDGEKIYGLIRLEQALSMPHDRRAKDRYGHPVLLVRLEDGTERAVLVQEILESREVVMKKFSRFVPQVDGIIGAAILGNGEVAPVIDLFDLLHAPLKKLLAAQPGQAEGVAPRPERRPRRALVVDDSLSARRAVVQVLKDEGYEIRTANDGLDAVAILEKWVPDIIISDMEMPRMNGLELTSNVRHAEQTKDVPVIMVTSRSTAKHRQMSAAAGVSLHMIKPFSDDELVRQVAKLTEKQS
jgi:chemotaxis protein histidine kinase CheA/ActR/RegA family two-component response regulator